MHRSGVAVPRARQPRAQHLALSLLDQVAAVGLVGADAAEAADVLELTRGAASALADTDTGAAKASRRRMLARLTAVEKTTMNMLVATLGDFVRSGLSDDHALRVARLLDTLANSSCRRLATLLGAAEDRAAAIAIENALVSVEAVE